MENNNEIKNEYNQTDPINLDETIEISSKFLLNSNIQDTDITFVTGSNRKVQALWRINPNFKVVSPLLPSRRIEFNNVFNQNTGLLDTESFTTFQAMRKLDSVRDLINKDKALCSNDTTILIPQKESNRTYVIDSTLSKDQKCYLLEQSQSPLVMDNTTVIKSLEKVWLITVSHRYNVDINNLITIIQNSDGELPLSQDILELLEQDILKSLDKQLKIIIKEDKDSRELNLPVSTDIHDECHGYDGLVAELLKVI
jgi:hypothetical protein